MKLIQSQIRHALTSLAALGTFFASYGLLDSAEAEQLNALGAEMAVPMATAFSVLTAGLVRFAIGFAEAHIKTIFKGKDAAVLLLFAAGLFFMLPSCAPALGRSDGDQRSPLLTSEEVVLGHTLLDLFFPEVPPAAIEVVEPK